MQQCNSWEGKLQLKYGGWGRQEQNQLFDKGTKKEKIGNLLLVHDQEVWLGVKKTLESRRRRDQEGEEQPGKL